MGFTTGGVALDAGQIASMTAALAAMGLIVPKRIALTANQLNHLSSSPITFVSAPGAGKALLYVGGACNYTFATTDFAVPFGNTALLSYGSRAGLQADNDGFSTFHLPFGGFGGSANEFCFGVTPNGVTDNDGTKIVNKALVLSTGVDATTPGDGTAIMTVYYTIITL